MESILISHRKKIGLILLGVIALVGGLLVWQSGVVSFKRLAPAQAQTGLPPALYYLDIESGPPGVFLTLNGRGFSASDTIKVGSIIAQPFAGQYTNYTPETVPSKVTVTVPNLPDGVYPVTVTTAGGTSNALNFTIRPGRVFYIAKDGSDANPGTIDQPWATLQHGGSQMQPGDFIYVREGLYRENPDKQEDGIFWGGSWGWSLTTTGEPGRPLTVQAYPGEEIIYTTKARKPGAFTIGKGKSYLNFIGLTITDVPTAAFTIEDGHSIRVVNHRIYKTSYSGIKIGAIWIGNISHIAILGNSITDVGAKGGNWWHSIYMGAGGEDIEIAYNKIFDEPGGIEELQAPDAITIASREYTALGVQIHHNLMYGFTHAAIDLFSSIGDVKIHNNIMVLDTMSRQGILVDKEQLPVDIYNNTIVSLSGVPTILTLSGPLTKIRNNILYSTSRTIIKGNPDSDYNLFFSTAGTPTEVLGSHSIVADPLFVNLDQRNFSLQTGSPAIDGGVTLAEVANDFIGIPRPQGAGFDMGAYEYISGGAVAIPKPQCSDSLDNDSDGRIDYPSDPGCTSANDSNETDPAPPACSDGTAYGQCSTTKPKYCENGVFLDKASQCGCPAGQIIAGDSCVVAAPHVTLTKSVDKTEAVYGDTLTFTLALKNTGNAEARNIAVSDPLDQNLENVSESASNGGTYDSTNRTVAWTVSSLAANATKTLSFKAKMALPTPEPQVQACLDSTRYNQCSSTKPKYCSNGTLIDKASQCGCPSGQTAQGEGCVTQSQTPPSSSTIDTGLIGYWKFDEGSGATAQDSSGNGNHGSIQGAVWTTGVSDDALQFDGNDYVNIPNLTAPVYKSFVLWVKVNSHSGSYNTLIEFADDNPWFGIRSNGVIELFEKYIVSNSSVIPGKWHHIVATSDATGSKLYLDGTLDATSSRYNSQTGTGMGVGFHSGDTGFNGLIDDVRIYDRTLSPTEISQLFNGGSLSSPPAQSQICSDGTSYNQCSSTKPKYCSNGTLIDKASQCGCPAGQTASGESCVTPTAPPASPPASSDQIRFAVIGDYGSGDSNEAAVATLVKSWNPDFVITTGDNNYPNGAASTIDQNIGQFYREYISPYTGSYGAGASENKFFPSLGNHDWKTPNAQPYLDYFTLPANERYYDFVKGPVHFFVLDSDPNEPDGTSSSSVQAQWLKTRLANSTTPFQFVYFHHDPYSSGSSNSSSIEYMQWPFAEWGAEAVLAGHDHIYERINRDGIVYFVNGLGGGSIYGLSTPVEGSAVRYQSNHGAMLVEANDTKATFQFITRTGEVIDVYTITSDRPPLTPSAFSFIIIADTQIGKYHNHKEFAAYINEHEPDAKFILASGDNVDNGCSIPQYEELVEHWQPYRSDRPYYPVPGNHEYVLVGYAPYCSDEEMRTYWRQYFGSTIGPLVEQNGGDVNNYYSFDYNNAHFAIYWTDDVTPGTTGWTWLENDLANSNAIWKFTLTHRPYVNDRLDPQFIDPFYHNRMKTFEQTGVDIQVAGHLHVYTRSKPITQTELDTENGVRYILVGSTGGPDPGLRDLCRGSHGCNIEDYWYLDAWNNRPNYAKVTIDGNTLLWEEKAVDGTVLDSFTLTK